MSHEVETMAYAGELPWHGLGTKVPDDLTPQQMLEAAGLDWTVSKVPAFAVVKGVQVPVYHSALVRDSDSRVLDVVGDDWNPVQNLEAFEFFNDFIAAGDMKMHTAGSLKNGQIVWALAQVNDGFTINGKDEVQSYLHFTNHHKYGFSTDVRFTPIRVVCWNTLSLSLNTQVDRMVKISHRREFNGDDVKLMLGVAADKLVKYKEMAQFLSSKRYTDETVVEYFKRVFPVTGSGKKEISKNASLAVQILETQPGAEFAEGSWWQAFNSVTYMTDHLMGRTDDNRMHSAWYGVNRNVKVDALELAVEMAGAE